MEFPRPISPGFDLMADRSAADWVLQRLWPWSQTGPQRLGTFLPEGFEAYARIFHPAYDSDRNTHRWADLARRNGMQLGPATRFEEICGVEPESRVWDEIVPDDGSLPSPQIKALLDLLQAHTQRPDPCWACYWVGWGHWGWGWSEDMPGPGMSEHELAELQERNRLTRIQEVKDNQMLEEIPVVRGGRDYFLFRTNLPLIPNFEIDGWFRSPSLMWPDDRAWCVMTEIDDYTTEVAGSRTCIEAIIKSELLEAVETTIDARF